MNKKIFENRPINVLVNDIAVMDRKIESNKKKINKLQSEIDVFEGTKKYTKEIIEKLKVR